MIIFILCVNALYGLMDNNIICYHDLNMDLSIYSLYNLYTYLCSNPVGMKLKLIKNVINVSEITIQANLYFIFANRIVFIKNKILIIMVTIGYH